MFNVLKEKSKREKKWYILSLFTKSMSLIQEVKDFWPYSLEILVKSNKKLEIKLIKKLLAGEKKEKLILYQEFCLLMKFICSILSAFHF